MVGRKIGAGSRTVWLTAATAILLGGLVAGCSSSGATAASAPPTTLNPAAIKRGIMLVVEPSAHPHSLKIPATFLACAAAKIPAGHGRLSRR